MYEVVTLVVERCAASDGTSEGRIGPAGIHITKTIYRRLLSHDDTFAKESKDNEGRRDRKTAKQNVTKGSSCRTNMILQKVD